MIYKDRVCATCLHNYEKGKCPNCDIKVMSGWYPLRASTRDEEIEKIRQKNLRKLLRDPDGALILCYYFQFQRLDPKWMNRVLLGTQLSIVANDLAVHHSTIVSRIQTICMRCNAITKLWYRIDCTDVKLAMFLCSLPWNVLRTLMKEKGLQSFNDFRYKETIKRALGRVDECIIDTIHEKAKQFL